jgi:hypothetical protein
MQASQSPSPFLALPRELRDQVYIQLFSLPYTSTKNQILANPLLLDISAHIPSHPLGLPISTSANSNPIPYTLLAPLCRTCKQLYWEATPFYLSTCLLSIEDTATANFLKAWLDTFGNAGWNAVRHVEILDLPRSDEPNSDEEESDLELELYKDTDSISMEHTLLSSSPNLTTLNIGLRNTAPLYGSFKPRPYRSIIFPDAVNRICTAYRLDTILSLKCLERLSFGLEDEGDIRARRIVSLNLQYWFERRWEERGRWVLVDCGFDADAESAGYGGTG